VPSTTGVTVNQEHPPSKLAVIVKAQDGTPIGRWAEDESKVENVLGDATKAGEMPGGHTESSQILARDPKQSYPDLALFARLEWQGAGGEVLWSGGTRQEPQSSGDTTSIEVKALGDKQFLEDDEEVLGPGFIDGDMTKLGDPSAARKASELTKAEKINIDAQVQLLPAGTPTPGEAEPFIPVAAISQAWAEFNNNEAKEPSTAESWYDSGGIPIGSVILDFLAVKGMGGWVSQVEASADGVALAEELHNFAGTSASNVEMEVAVGRFFLMLRTYYPSAWAALSNSEAQWRNIKVRGRDDLTLQGTWPNVGFTAKQMLPSIAALAGLTTEDELLEDDGFVIPQAWFSDPATPMSKLVEVTKYGLLDWFVFEHQLLQYRVPGTYGRKWRLASGASAPKNSGPDASRVWDALMVTWQDTDGTTKRAGRPGSGAQFEDSRLQILDPRNAAVAAGRPRRKLLALNGLCEAGPAIRTGQRFLEEAANLDQSGEATITGYCQDSYGIWWPAAYVQPGDWAADPGTQNYRKITSASYAHASKTASVSLSAPPEGLGALEARFNARLIERGLGS
jgi:hypothetical protein